LTANPGVVPAVTTGATVKSYQWSSATTATGVYTNIDGATLSMYTLTGADAARFVKVTVTWAKDGNGDTPKVSAATVAVAPGTFAAAPVPTISGTLTVGQTLTANEGTRSPAQDSFTYQWQWSATATGTYANVASNGTGKTYVLQPADRGRFIRVVVTAVKAGYTSSPATSAATVAVNAPFASAPTPTITVAGGGPAQVGRVLTAVPGSWSPAATLSYVWKRGSTIISGATASTYTVTPADLGQPITVTVTGTLATYVTTSRESAATANVIKGVFTPEQKSAMITGVTNAMLAVEGENLRGVTEQTCARRGVDEHLPMRQLGEGTPERLQMGKK
jgi:hypothetical protein